MCDKKIVPDKNGKLLTTATLARLSLSSEWRKIKKNSAELLKIISAKGLLEKFPYPCSDCDSDCEEMRIRPAYYYTQSAVIPYRYNKGKLQILLILSSKKNHYVLPKGIKEPGLTPRESAALEEAGIKGKIAADAMASYQYEKWKATTTVAVYPMEVTQMIDEKHRGRKWVSPKVAAEKLFQPALKTMVLELKQYLANT